MRYLIIVFLCIPLLSYSQADTIIKNNVLESHFSYKHHNPLYVKYKLYQGGGNCNRSQFCFKTNNLPHSATKNDYAYSGYDIGHLCPAEDFSYDCSLEQETFYFYNAIPQTPNLNRGIWKHFENEIRKDSQHDSLLIICGAVYDDVDKINSISVPVNCWKVVKSLSTNKILYCLWFTNGMEDNEVKHLPLEQLEKFIGYKLGL